MTSPVRPLVLAVGIAIALGACGGGAGGLSATTRTRLEPLVEQIRRAAESRDRQGTQRALAQLQTAVAADEQNGDISPTKAAQILAAAAQVQSRLPLIPTTTTTPTTTTPTTRPPDQRHHGNDNKGNKGNGDGND